MLCAREWSTRYEPHKDAPYKIIVSRAWGFMCVDVLDTCIGLFSCGQFAAPGIKHRNVGLNIGRLLPDAGLWYYL